MALLFHEDALSGIPRHDVERLLQKTEWLWKNRSTVNHFPLSENLSGFFKRRLGKYRILYTYDPNSDDLIVHLVGLRDDIYRRAR